MSRWCVFALVCWCVAGTARADDHRTPYKIRVVVDAAKQRLLTDVFRDQLVRELGDALRVSYGPLAKIEVTQTHPKLKDIRERGLERALDGMRERSEYRTWFVLVDYADATYQVQARMHDGQTGLPTPLVRRNSTRDRAYVARVAALLLDEEPAFLGTVVDSDSRTTARIRLQGGDIVGSDINKRIKRGDVFSLARVPATGPGQPVLWAFLQAVGAPVEGVCECKLFSRYDLSGVPGMRCTLLATVPGPLNLRLRERRKGGKVVKLSSGSVTLEVRRNGFEGEEQTLIQKTLSRSEDINLSGGDKGEFDKLAFVTVLSSGVRRARIPVPMLGLPVTVIELPAIEEADLGVEFDVLSLLRRVSNAYLVQADQFKEINDLTAKPDKRTEALKVVRETLERSQNEHEILSRERDRLREKLDKLPANKRPSLAGIDKRLQMIKSGEGHLTKHVSELQKIEKEENDPKRKEALVQLERAGLLEKELEIGQAIAAYDKVSDELKSDKVKAHVAELRKKWEPKNEKHAKARRFLYEVWPGLDTDGVKKRHKEAREACETCMAEGDKFGPAKMLLAMEKHLERIDKELSELKPDVNIDDKQPVEELKLLFPELQKLSEDVTVYLK